MMGGKNAGTASGAEVFVLHVKAAGGTKERLAGAVSALAFQTLC